jgi:hypothetical protein
VPVKVSIPLRTLFKYPNDVEPLSEGMNMFWKSGIKNLENEMEAYESLSSVVGREENTDEVNFETPAMPDFV